MKFYKIEMQSLFMGEIIIKIPEDVHEEIKLDISYKEVKEKLKEMEENKKLLEEFLSINLDEKVKKKTLDDTKGDFYEAIIETND